MERTTRFTMLLHLPRMRGTNEKWAATSVFPEGKGLSIHGTDDLAAVAAALNAKPRRTLQWRTPAEAIDAALQSAQDGVATTS
jgi:IS30 family transposase